MKQEHVLGLGQWECSREECTGEAFAEPWSCCRGLWFVLELLGWEQGPGGARDKWKFRPQEPGSAAAAAAGIGWDRANVGNWSSVGFAVFLAIFGRAATYSPQCPWQAENKTKPKTDLGPGSYK